MEEAKCSDVLVVGAGPAGLFTSLMLARCGIKNLAVIDRRAIPVKIGHASGIQPRSQEIIHTLGLYHDWATGANKFTDTAFWTSAHDGDDLKRSVADCEFNLPTAHQEMVIQHQGRTEAVLNAELNKRGIEVFRPFEFVDYQYTDDADYPICAFIRDIERGHVDKWHCKYMIAADGASSHVRDLAGLKSPIQQTDDVWVVTDSVVETDFPDHRRRSAIRTTRGNLMLIPSPNNTLRIYTLLTKDEEQKAIDNSEFYSRDPGSYDSMTKDTLLDVLQRKWPAILNPFSIKVKHVLWISIYTIAQRVIEKFRDGKRLLFIGDSCHSHSPKSAQGMNTAIYDAYNLSWKLALILRGHADPEILLDTYNVERKHIAQQLIDFDTKFAGLFGDQSKIDTPEFHQVWKDSQGFTSGLHHQYPAESNPSVGNVQGVEINSNAAEPLTPGKRFLPMNVRRHCDGLPLCSLDTMPLNGDFYYIIFAGDISSEPRKTEFANLYNHLTASQVSSLTTYNGSSPPSDPKEGDGKAWPLQDIHTNSDHPQNSDKVLNLFVVHTASRFSVDLRPQFEMWKYNFFEDKDGHEHILHGIDPNGEMVVAIVRPDHMVGMVRKADEQGDADVHAYLEGMGLKKAKSDLVNGVVNGAKRAETVVENGASALHDKVKECF